MVANSNAPTISKYVLARTPVVLMPRLLAVGVDESAFEVVLLDWFLDGAVEDSSTQPIPPAT